MKTEKEIKREIEVLKRQLEKTYNSVIHQMILSDIQRLEWVLE